MPKLIKNKQLSDNEWSHVADLSELSSARTQKVLVSTEAWSDSSLGDKRTSGELGLFIESDQTCADLPKDFSSAPVIAVNFPAFTDGRGYTIARELREKLSYTGEVRAVGDVLHDQLNSMARCGFDAFELVDDKDADKAIASFADFTNKYQADLVEPKPVYQR